jgi:hypothetical protein
VHRVRSEGQTVRAWVVVQLAPQLCLRTLSFALFCRARLKDCGLAIFRSNHSNFKLQTSLKVTEVTSLGLDAKR